jgi:hypothetical protein
LEACKIQNSIEEIPFPWLRSRINIGLILDFWEEREGGGTVEPWNVDWAKFGNEASSLLGIKFKEILGPGPLFEYIIRALL